MILNSMSTKQGLICLKNLKIKHFICFTKKRKNRGALVFVLSIIMALISIIILALNTSLIEKNKSQINVMKYTRKEGLINAILSHAMNELKQSFASAGTCSLAPLVAPASINWNVNNPQFYHVGQFQIQILDNVGQPTGMFESPEEPPKVWITAVPSSSLYTIHISTSICKFTLGGLNGRSLIPKNTVDADIAAAPSRPPGWTAPPSSYTWPAHSSLTCPAADIIPLSYEGIVNTDSWGGVWTLYFDRGFYSNVAQEEPADLSNIDVEEYYGGAPASETVSPLGEIHYTGANHELILPTTACPTSSRVLTAYRQIFDQIKNQDPCGKIALYTVGGSSTVGVAASTPWQIAPVTPVVPGSAGVASYVPISSGYNAITTSYIPNMCGKKPAGYFNLLEVAKHYLSNHQDPAYLLSAADRSKTHVLALVTDGTGFGTVRPPTEPSVGGTRRSVLRSNIYYEAIGTTAGNCTGQGYIDSIGIFDPTAWYVAGDDLFEYDNSGLLPIGNPLPAINPPLAPLPASAKLMGSVRNGKTGACEPIFLSSPTYSYSGAEYPYFIKNPKPVKLRVSVPTKLSDVLKNYAPTSGWLTAFAGLVDDPTTGIQDYPNAFIVFPMPVTDLDESDSYTYNYSKRNFDIGDICQKDREGLVVPYSQFFAQLGLRSFKAKASFEGLICP